jgi:FecR protein
MFLLVVYLLSQVHADFKFLRVKGDVKLHSSNGVTEARESMIAKLEDTIISGPDSIALIRGNGLTFKISENSQVKLQQKDDQLKILASIGGGVINFMKTTIKTPRRTQLQVVTSNATMGIRGTTFFIHDLTGKSTYLTVQEGSVEFEGNKVASRILTKSGESSFTDLEQTASKKKNRDFETHINWAIDPLESDLKQPKILFREMDAAWSQYKVEQEKKWNQKKTEDKDLWNSYKNGI